MTARVSPSNARLSFSNTTSSTPNTSNGMTAWEYVVPACPALRAKYGTEAGTAPKLPENKLVRQLGNLLPVNQLVFRPGHDGLTAERFKEGNDTSTRNCNLKAILIQVTGRPQKLARACHTCLKGDGLWVGCVKAPDQLSNRLSEACACCLYSNRSWRCRPAEYAMPPPFTYAPVQSPMTGAAQGHTTDALRTSRDIPQPQTIEAVSASRNARREGSPILSTPKRQRRFSNVRSVQEEDEDDEDHNCLEEISPKIPGSLSLSAVRDSNTRVNMSNWYLNRTFRRSVNLTRDSVFGNDILSATPSRKRRRGRRDTDG